MSVLRSSKDTGNCKKNHSRSPKTENGGAGYSGGSKSFQILKSVLGLNFPGKGPVIENTTVFYSFDAAARNMAGIEKNGVINTVILENTPLVSLLPNQPGIDHSGEIFFHPYLDNM